jgi:hypothetical protein
LIAALTLAGCGGDSGAAGASSSTNSLIPWPLFGRIPERTHYLPANERVLDPPLREAGRSTRTR